MTVSIIIPTLNEEVYLPGLLDAIRRQTWPPLGIIVADAGSSDQTVEMAREAGCRVVPGGRPARGRNAGAAVAQGDVFLFLDADVLPPPDFLARALPEFNARRLPSAAVRWEYRRRSDARGGQLVLACLAPDLPACAGLLPVQSPLGA